MVGTVRRRLAHHVHVVGVVGLAHQRMEKSDSRNGSK